MGARKKASKPNRGSGVDVQAVRQLMQQDLLATAGNVPAVPTCLSKLVSPNPAEREEACVDVMHFSLVPAHFEALTFHGAHRLVSHLLKDQNVHVRGAAAAALRNLLTNGTDQHIDDVVREENIAAVIGQTIQELISQYGPLAELVALDNVNKGEVEAKIADVENEEGETEADGEADQRAALLGGIEFSLEEFFQLTSVIAEGNEPASVVFSTAEFLSMVLSSIVSLGHSPRDSCVAIAVAAAECLHLLSSDNDAVALFIGTQLTPEQLAELNSWIQGGSTVGGAIVMSPRLMRMSVALCGTLLNCQPNEQNVRRVLPVVCYALKTLPMKEWTRTLPLLSENCTMSEEVRCLAVAQSCDRFRALQTAVDVLTRIIGFACEDHDDTLDDEEAFAQNPNAAILAEHGAFVAVADVIKDLLDLSPDAIASRALREATPNPDASTLQHLFLSVEVGIFGLASTLLLMLPVTSLAPFPVVWRVTVAALQRRYELVTASDDSLVIATESPPAMNLLMLQLESLAEMSWTIQRKDSERASNPLPQDLDVFTRLAWCSKSSDEARIFCVGTVSCIGMLYREVSTEAMTSCARFCIGVLSEAKNSLDVRAEAANSIMDLFSDEMYDATLYQPSGCHAVLKSLLNDELLPCIKSSRRSGNSAQNAKIEEIADNLKRFVPYKEKHCPGL